MKNALEKLIEEGLSQRGIAKSLGKDQSFIRRRLKEYGLVTKHQNNHKPEYNACVVCDKPTLRRKLCSGCYTKVRRYRTKLKAIKLLGEKCNRCGWTGNIAAFEFHHINDDKHFTIGNVANKSWDLIKKEIEKCELLCSNCHQIEHSNNQSKKFLSAVEKYKGRILD